MYLLYPEDPGNLNRVKNEPAHIFFKTYGENMPRGDWNHPGTKQGIYMIGPNAEYLEGKFAAAADPKDILARMKRALQKWETLKTQKGYANQQVPPIKSQFPPGYEGELIFRINSRDLPRGPGDQSGRRITAAEQRQSQGWPDFTKWAWNESWFAETTASTFLPKSSTSESISQVVIRRFARENLIDNVRGQVPEWTDQQVQSVNLTMRRLGVINGKIQIEYRGAATISAGNRSLNLTAYGEGEYDPKAAKFTQIEIVWTGMRSGAAQFNQRERDHGPAPIGFTMSLTKQ